MLCGDTAHLHKEVLPEVVLGEFHAAIRAPFITQRGKCGNSGSGSRKKSRGMMMSRSKGGDDVSAAAAKKKRFSQKVLVGQFGRVEGGKETGTYLRSLISLKNCKSTQKKGGEGEGKGGERGKGGFSHLEIHADYGQVSA